MLLGQGGTVLIFRVGLEGVVLTGGKGQLHPNRAEGRREGSNLSSEAETLLH